MKFLLDHVNLPVANIEKSLAFYAKALGLHELRRIETEAFTGVVVSDGVSEFNIHLVEYKDHRHKYDLGENEFHVGFMTADIDAARKLHREMKCVSYENPTMGIYFIEDPDEHWLEVLPVKKPGQADGTHAGFVQNHVNINVADSAKAIAFYEKAFGWHLVRENKSESYRISFLSDERDCYFLELTSLKNHPKPYDLGDNPRRIVAATDDAAAALAEHERQGLHINRDIEGSKAYSVTDPDQYVTRVVETTKR